MQEWTRQFRKGLLELCVLNVLGTSESYGYKIVRNLEQYDELAVSESTLYPILSRLRKDGFLKVRVGPSQSGPPRRYFSLTNLGRTYTEGLNRYWDDLTRAVNRLRRSIGKEIQK